MSAAGNAPAKEAPLSPDGSELTAWFLKKGESFLSRPFRRFFVLDLEQVLPAIVYFTDETRKDEKGTIPVATLTRVETSGESCLSLVTKDRTFELESESIEVRTAWVAALTRFIDDETPDRERSCESRSSEGVYGMVCPECKDLFSTEDALMAHYDNAHSDTVRIARASSISSRTESSSEVPVWSEQPLGVARKLWSDFATARSELSGGGRHAHPVILTRLQTLLYKKPATTSEKKFEKTVVAWVADDSAKKCKDCGAAFSSGLLKNLFDQAALSRHHCRLCGLLVCDQCAGMGARSRARRQRPPAGKCVRHSSGTRHKRSRPCGAPSHAEYRGRYGYTARDAAAAMGPRASVPKHRSRITRLAHHHSGRPSRQ
eukprot:m.302650 g.302650  ORF g.302650 m.302650 type:complete len:374 (+) comp27291_c0_seq6:85-1206(+)